MSDQDRKHECERSDFARLDDDARYPIDRAELHRLLDELLDLRERTDPAAGHDPGSIRFGKISGKDTAARYAVKIEVVLLKATGGWAINHIAGCVLLDAKNRSVDGHKNERAGIAEYNFPNGVSRGDDKASTDRMVIQALLEEHCIHSIFPGWLASDLAGALGALDFGEVWSLLKPANRGLHTRNPLQIAFRKLFAIRYINFLIGQE
jgi:hypothetical protein